MLQESDRAPDFELRAADGSTVRLSDLRGRTVVLYFYPRADTPGCTTEACEFRDSAADLGEAGAVVLGVSPDEVEAVRKFSQKYSLNFPLLADPDHRVAEAYGVWKEKSRYGRKSWGVERTTFVIGPDGSIQRIYGRVRPEGHAAEVLADLGRA